MSATLDYDQQTLNRLASDTAQPLGTLTGWAVRVHNKGASLVVYYDAADTFETKDVTVAL